LKSPTGQKMTDLKTIALPAETIAARQKPSAYPEPFFTRMLGRSKRQLANAFGLKNFGVNMTELAPGGESSLMHRHTRQDEFIYILSGHPTLRTDEGEMELAPGMCAGFPAGGIAHHLVNRTDAPVVYLEIGDRTPGDEGHYPEDDLLAVMENGNWVFKHKDGVPYE
jgi:uncharacterized cupin superfamily protein